MTITNQQRYGVLEHSSGRSSGYVVRTGYLQDDGSVWFPAPYNATSGHSGPVKVYKSAHYADKHADKLNGMVII